MNLTELSTIREWYTVHDTINEMDIINNLLFYT